MKINELKRVFHDINEIQDAKDKYKIITCGGPKNITKLEEFNFEEGELTEDRKRELRNKCEEILNLIGKEMQEKEINIANLRIALCFLSDLLNSRE
jgi:hypothetical protein